MGKWDAEKARLAAHARREDYRKRGICYICGKRLTARGSALCKACVEARATRYKQKKLTSLPPQVIEDLPGEIWKPVAGYEGYYEISNLGRVRSLTRTDCSGAIRIGRLKAATPTSKYLTVKLSKNGKTLCTSLHRLMAQAFISNPLNLPQVNHKDGNKHNSSIDNFEWVTAKGNLKHASNMRLIGGEQNGRAKVTEALVKEIRNLSLTFTNMQLSVKYNLPYQLIYRITSRKMWKRI